MAAVFTCSIDDGNPLDVKMAELLCKHGLNGTFFVPIFNREGPPVLSKSQLLEMSARFEIGSHTHDHCYLKDMSLRDANEQIISGKCHLEDMVGHSIDGFCYPGGKFLQRHLSLVKAAGFMYARTTTNLCIDPGTCPFEVPTTIQFYPHSKSVYLRNFLQSGHWDKRAHGLYLALLTENWIERVYALFNYCCERDGVFHLWAHSIEIDQLDAWKQLDGFLAYVASRIARENRLSNRQLAERALYP
ncbi:polysaccharide deacetylase family protein [Massilia aerilata]|uniref:Polysaccharide deacetylase family protein n=1 Tax=Massilia aerilata TaxID=453817 RepID=A0ABW0S655_9BURK